MMGTSGESKKVNVLGIPIDAVDYESASDRVIAAAREGRGYAVSALAVHGVMSGVMDPELRYCLNRFEMITPDGQPVRWAMNWLGSSGLRDRVYGPFLTRHVCRKAAAEGLSVFLFGSRPEVLEKLEAHLTEAFPGLPIAGRRPSRFRQATDTEVEEDVAVIRESGAAIVLVGLGCPRQEFWAYEMRHRVSRPCLAVGAAFDFFAGTLPMAPRWMQDAGLEWLYRLCREPVRLWKRYLFLNPAYLTHLILQKTGIRSFEGDAGREPAKARQFG